MINALRFAHRWAGGLIGLLLALLGLSGAMLVHRDAWVMASHAAQPQVTDTAAIAAVVDRLMSDAGDRPRSITFASPSFGLHRLALAEGAGAYTDPTGDVVTRWESQWSRPELWLFDFHHHLFAGRTGETVAGVAGAAGVLFIVSGLILWWPTRRLFAPRVLPRRFDRSAVVRHHRDLGVLVAPLLLLSTVTGTSLVFRPLTALYLGRDAPAMIDASLAAPEAAGARLGAQLDWGGLIREGRARFPEAEVRSLTLPRDKSGLITLRMRKPEEWLPNGRTTLWFAADTGRLVAARDDAQLPAVVKAYNALYPLHAAKVGGLPYRLVMTVSGLSLAMLGGFAVWSFWFAGARKPRRQPAVAQA